MNEELFGGERSTSMSGDFTKALIEKMIGHGTDLREISDQIRNLADPTPALERVDQQMGELVNRLDILGENIRRTGEDLGRLSQNFAFPADSIAKLEDRLQQHALLFDRPLKKSVHYTHFLGRSLIVSASLVVVIIGLTLLWNRTQIKADQHIDSDIKWRTAKLTTDSLVLVKLEEIERTYQINPDWMKNATIAEEQRRQELFEQWQLVHQASSEIDRLNARKNMR